jgi:hypothetical protein
MNVLVSGHRLGVIIQVGWDQIHQPGEKPIVTQQNFHWLRRLVQQQQEQNTR